MDIITGEQPTHSIVSFEKLNFSGAFSVAVMIGVAGAKRMLEKLIGRAKGKIYAVSAVVATTFEGLFRARDAVGRGGGGAAASPLTRRDQRRFQDRL